LFVKSALGALGKRCSRESQELLESLGNLLESLDMALGGLLEPLGRTLARLLPRHLSGVLKSLAKVP
jgi:hypothetical protein